MAINTLQTKRETIETIRLSDSLVRTLYFSADSIDLKLCDSIVTIHAVNAKLGHQSQTTLHYGQTAMQNDTLTQLKCQNQSEAVQTETGVIAMAPNGKGTPLPWLLAAVLIVFDGCLLLWHKRHKKSKR